jgi:hypothetical protein
VKYKWRSGPFNENRLWHSRRHFGHMHESLHHNIVSEDPISPGERTGAVNHNLPFFPLCELGLLDIGCRCELGERNRIQGITITIAVGMPHVKVHSSGEHGMNDKLETKHILLAL